MNRLLLLVIPAMLVGCGSFAVGHEDTDQCRAQARALDRGYTAMREAVENCPGGKRQRPCQIAAMAPRVEYLDQRAIKEIDGAGCSYERRGKLERLIRNEASSLSSDKALLEQELKGTRRKAR